MSFKRHLQNYITKSDGNIAVMTALLGIPLIMVAGYAIDYNQAFSHKNGIESALDAATLAAVVPANLGNEERAEFAQQIFDKNYFGNIDVKLDINALPDRVDIAAVGAVPTLFGSIVGMDTISVGETSAAVLTKSDVVCALALDPTGEGAIEFLDNAQFLAPECSVQANSTNSQAIKSESSYTPSAKSFCAAGNTTGRYTPFVKHACTTIADPYADLTTGGNGGSTGGTTDETMFSYRLSAALSASTYCHNLGLILSVNEYIQDSGWAEDTIGSNTILPPGNYCNGLRLAGLNITFLPGTYNISGGNLHFESFATAKGDGVTFVLQGGESNLTIESGAEASFIAPENGDYAGLVFYQKPANGTSTANYPDGQSIIGSGGGLDITGTAYFPTQELIITSDRPVASKAPATSFIAYRLKFAGDSKTEVHVDHETGGIPPLLPRSDDGARLVSYVENTPKQDD